MTANLIRILECRLLEGDRRGHSEKPFEGLARAHLAAVMAFLRGETDDTRIARLLGGLACVRLPEAMPPGAVECDIVPAAFSLLKPLFVTNGLLRWFGLLREDGMLTLPQELVRLLASGNLSQAQTAFELAHRRLRIAGMTVPPYPRTLPAATALDSVRLLCALMIPLEPGDVARVCRRISPENDDQTA